MKRPVSSAVKGWRNAAASLALMLRRSRSGLGGDFSGGLRQPPELWVPGPPTHPPPAVAAPVPPQPLLLDPARGGQCALVPYVAQLEPSS